MYVFACSIGRLHLEDLKSTWNTLLWSWRKVWIRSNLCAIRCHSKGWPSIWDHILVNGNGALTTSRNPWSNTAIKNIYPKMLHEWLFFLHQTITWLLEGEMGWSGYFQKWNSLCTTCGAGNLSWPARIFFIGPHRFELVQQNEMGRALNIEKAVRYQCVRLWKFLIDQNILSLQDYFSFLDT